MLALREVMHSLIFLFANCRAKLAPIGKIRASSPPSPTPPVPASTSVVTSSFASSSLTKLGMVLEASSSRGEAPLDAQNVERGRTFDVGGERGRARSPERGRARSPEKRLEAQLRLAADFEAMGGRVDAAREEESLERELDGIRHGVKLWRTAATRRGWSTWRAAHRLGEARMKMLSRCILHWEMIPNPNPNWMSRCILHWEMIGLVRAWHSWLAYLPSDAAFRAAAYMAKHQYVRAWLQWRSIAEGLSNRMGSTELGAGVWRSLAVAGGYSAWRLAYAESISLSHVMKAPLSSS